MSTGIMVSEKRDWLRRAARTTWVVTREVLVALWAVVRVAAKVALCLAGGVFLFGILALTGFMSSPGGRR